MSPNNILHCLPMWQAEARAAKWRALSSGYNKQELLEPQTGNSIFWQELIKNT